METITLQPKQYGKDSSYEVSASLDSYYFDEHEQSFTISIPENNSNNLNFDEALSIAKEQFVNPGLSSLVLTHTRFDIETDQESILRIKTIKL